MAARIQRADIWLFRVHVLIWTYLPGFGASFSGTLETCRHGFSNRERAMGFEPIVSALATPRFGRLSYAHKHTAATA